MLEVHVVPEELSGGSAPIKSIVVLAFGINFVVNLSRVSRSEPSSHQEPARESGALDLDAGCVWESKQTGATSESSELASIYLACVLLYSSSSSCIPARRAVCLPVRVRACVCTSFCLHVACRVVG